jgi:hypothetical protein
LESGLGDGHTCSHSGVIHLSVSGSGYGFDREGRLLIRRGEDRVFREPEDFVDLFAGIALPFERDIDLVNIRPDMVRLYTGGCGCWGLESGPRTPDIVRARPSPVMSIHRIPRFEIVTDRLVFPGCFFPGWTVSDEFAFFWHRRGQIATAIQKIDFESDARITDPLIEINPATDFAT